MKITWPQTDKLLARQLTDQESLPEFLKFFYQTSKKSWSDFSYAWIARESGLSKSLVVGIFSGKKNLTAKTLPPFMKALGMGAALSEYFRFLTEVDSKTNELTPAKRKSQLKHLRNLYLDSLEELSNIETKISDPDFALLYAALGDQEKGATIEEISRKINWDIDRIRFVLHELQIKKFIKESGERWRGTKLFLSTIARSRDGWLPKLFFSSLGRHEDRARQDFLSKDHLSAVYAICIQEEDFEKMNAELKEASNRIAQKYHDGSGDKVVSIILGSHKV